MKTHFQRPLLVLSLLIIGACGDDPPQDSLTGGGPKIPDRSRSPSSTEGNGQSTTGSPGNDFPHNDGASAPGAGEETVDPAQVRAVGSPEVTSRLHGCGKLTVSSIGNILQTRNLMGGGRAQGEVSGLSLYNAGDSPAALGAPNYSGRVPEAPFASTSATAKMFDIYTMASYDVLAPDWEAPACPGVKVIGADGRFTKDGISCLMGKPATDEHVAIANDAIIKNPTDGAKIAIAALLAAAHTCQ